MVDNRRGRLRPFLLNPTPKSLLKICYWMAELSTIVHYSLENLKVAQKQNTLVSG